MENRSAEVESETNGRLDLLTSATDTRWEKIVAVSFAAVLSVGVVGCDYRALALEGDGFGGYPEIHRMNLRMIIFFVHIMYQVTRATYVQYYEIVRITRSPLSH